LPLVDAQMPHAAGEPVAGWLVTPVAEVSFKALEDAELREVVQAIHEVAEALAELHADPGKAHRDLKPSNLFRWEGQWVVGDFGLVTGDDSEALTAPGRIVGPINFVAYEVMSDPRTADPFRADVFSLAKTLWVLATAQRWPPGGHQRAGELPIGQFRSHRRTELLDALVDRGTSLQPEDRTSMAEFATELRTWLDIDDEKANEFSLGDYGAELRARAAPYFETERQERERGEAAYAAYEALVERLDSIIGELERVLPGVVRNPEQSVMINMLRSHPGLGEPQVLSSWAEGVRVAQPGKDFPIGLRMTALLERLGDGTLRLSAAIVLGRDGESISPEDFWAAEERRAPTGSIEVQAQIEALGRELEQHLPEWVHRYGERAY
jgi:serine/threonine protein kinase